MQITEIKVFLVDEPKLKAFVSIVLDHCFMVNDIKVIRGRDGLFVSMPSRRKKSGEFKDVAHPLNNETRAWMEGAILAEYRETVAAEKGVSKSEDAQVRPLSSTGHHEGEGPSSQVASGRRGSDGALEGAATSSLDDVRRRHLSDSYWNVG